MAGYWAEVSSGRIARRRLLKAGAALSIGAGALALLGCSDSDSADSAAQVQSLQSDLFFPGPGEPKEGGKLGTRFGAIGNYNTVAFINDAFYNTGITVYDRLMTQRLDDRKYVLEAAASMEQPDPTSVVFKLKPGLVFQNKAPVNGHAVTSADILASQAYIKALPNAENSSFVREYVSRMEAPDASTIVYHLTAPFAYSFGATALASPSAQPIIPKEMLDGLDSTPPIGSGPYELVDHTFGQRYSYKRFEQFRDIKDHRPYITERETIFTADPVAEEAAFRSEQTHIWEPPVAQIDRITKELDATKFRFIDFSSPFLVTLGGMMNATLGGPRPWHDVRFREAIYRSMNRQQFIDLAIGGRGVVPPGPISASLKRYQLDPKDSEQFWKYDPTAAKQLLSAMNYDTSKEWEVSGSNSNVVNGSYHEIWQQQIAPLGIKLRPILRPLPELLSKYVQTGQFDFIMHNSPGGDDPFRQMRLQHTDTKQQYNYVGLQDKTIDSLIEQSEQTVNSDENEKLVKRIQIEAMKQYSLTINVLTVRQPRIYNAKLQNFEVDVIGGQIYGTSSWMA